jgi:putative acetyltransferase
MLLPLPASARLGAYGRAHRHPGLQPRGAFFFTVESLDSWPFVIILEPVQLQAGLFSVDPQDFPRLVEVWEASVRATHHFVSEADIQFFRPLVRAGLPGMDQLACVRDTSGQVAGFVAVSHRKVEMLFIHPGARGQGAGRRLLDHAISTFGATQLDVNEQNEQALGFYLHMGFEVAGRSELDGTGKPYPLLHLCLAGPARGNSSGEPAA